MEPQGEANKVTVKGLSPLNSQSFMSIPTSFDLIKTLRLSVELIPDNTYRIWRVIWKETAEPKMHKFNEQELKTEAIMSALKFIQQILAQEPQEGLPLEKYTPLKEWSLNELDIIERNYILTAKLCDKGANIALSPSISLRIPITLNATPHLADAINSEVKDMLEQYNLSEDASSFSSSSPHDTYKDILQDNDEDELESGKVSEDEEMQRNLDFRLKGFFEVSPPETTSTSPSPYIKKGQKRFQNTDEEINNKKSKHPRFTKSSKTQVGVPRKTLPKKYQNESIEDINFINQDQDQTNPNTEEQELTMLVLLEKLQQELVNEHSQLSTQNPLNVGVQMDEYFELLKEIPSILQESLLKMRCLDTDARFLMFDKCIPLHKYLSQIYSDKRKMAEVLLQEKNESSETTEQSSNPTTLPQESHSQVHGAKMNNNGTTSPSELKNIFQPSDQVEIDSFSNPMYWEEDELQKLRLCENFYSQAESAFSLKISLCDNLHSMLQDRLNVLDSQFNNNLMYHDLLYGQDVVNPNSITSNLHKAHYSQNTKQKSFPIFSRSSKNSCSESVIPPSKETARSSPPL